MRLFIEITLLVAVLSSVGANPAKRNPRPPTQVEEEDPNDSLHPGPHNPPLEQNDKPVLESTQHEDDDMVLMKRRPYQGSNIWTKSGDTVEIPYNYTTTDADEIKVLQRAIEVFNAKTCVRFVAAQDDDERFVTFKVGSSCSSTVGQSEGGQSCYLTSTCASNKGKVLHEMMHILGFLHEQCRPDRDSYITVHTDRIRSGAEPNFNIITNSVDQGLPYDCDSILHYKSTAFAATSGQETITSTHCSHLGNSDTRLSLLDYRRVNLLYSCDKPQYKYYTVRVVTDGSWLSGTDCFIYLTLHGSAQTSTEFELDVSTNPSANLFEAGSDDTFNYMAYRYDLGTITGMSLRMVNHKNAPGWWPTMFTITDPATNAAVTFTNNQWLSPSSTYGTSAFPKQS